MTVAVLTGLALVFGFLNGYNGSGSLVATLISTGAIGPRRALILAAIASFAGLFLFGLAVAVVIGTGIVEPNGITLVSMAAALSSALIWNALASVLGIPSSSSHALVGGLIGGGIAAGGLAVVEPSGLEILVLALLVAPLLAIVLGWFAMNVTLWLVRGATPRINGFFRRSQLITSLLLAMAFGTANGQKVAGVIALVLYQARLTRDFTIPEWVIVSTALSLSLGIGTGGWRVIRTLGARIFRLRPIHGFAAQSTAVLIVLVATLFGGPVSLNQITSSAIIGAGIAERMSKVRWEVAEYIVLAWLVTLPATALLAIVLYPVALVVVG